MEMADDQENLLKNYLKIIKERIQKSIKETLESQILKSAEESLVYLENKLTEYFEEHKYDLNIHDFEEIKQKLDGNLIEKERKQETSCVF